MDVLTAMTGRRSVRAFLDQPLSTSLIVQVLEAARWAPSGVNTQPWQVMVLGPQIIHTLGDALLADMATGTPNRADYAYYPSEWVEPYVARRKACGLALYGALGIEKEDTVGRTAQWHKNYHFFGAPRGLLFLMDGHLEKGSWLDLGMFLENVMLAARGLGLETCAQASLAERPDIVRQICQIDDRWQVVCGMAIGYADWDNPVNQYRTERASVDEFTMWRD